MLFTVPRTSTKRRSRKRMPRSDRRSSARSTVTDVARPPAVSVFGVGDSFVLRVRRTSLLEPGRAGSRMIGRSPGLVVFYRMVHTLLLFC